MKTAHPPTDQIDVRDLRVGMFVHLDIGWMSHPFPLSSFRIATAAQLATIRSLGLRTVRWSPQQSDTAGVEPGPATTLPGPLPLRTGDAANDSGLGAEVDAVDTVPFTPAEDNVVDAATHARQRAQAERQRKLARQHAAEQRCTRQYVEAARTCKQTLELVHSKPHEARAQAEALSRAITGKMIGEQDLCIRMLVEGAGDRASMHAMNVGVISLLMGRCFGFIDEEMQDLGVGAMLHDVGKLELPVRLRHREENFSPNEMRVYQEHVEAGVVQAKRMGLSAGATAVIAQHHEHADGSGFPERLNSDRMTMAARIVALVNRYDNLCNPHVLARALSPHESLSLLFAQGRSKYDTSILGAFIKMMGVYPPGSMVQLTDDRYALVVAVNSTRPLKPSVVVHDAATPREEALVLDLETAAGLGIRRSVRAQQVPPTAIDYLQPSTRVTYFFEASRAAGTDDDE
jgi:HD-GYP domain-containing protein (c-di-GMP phosphodiesterase class II)